VSTVRVVDHEALLRQSVRIARAQRQLMPTWGLISPFDIIRHLNLSSIRFLLVGSFGMCGWRNQARAAGYSEIVVGKSVLNKATSAILERFPRLKKEESERAIDLVHTTKGNVAINIAKSSSSLFSDAFGDAVKMEGKAAKYKIPSLEMSIALTYAEMTSPNTELALRYQAAHDLICIVNANEMIDEEKLLRLEALIPPDSGSELVESVKLIQRGEKLRL
jgi:hypothetical protein